MTPPRELHVPFRRVIFIILPLTHTLALNKSHKKKPPTQFFQVLSLSRSRAIRQFNPRHFRLANCAPLAATLPPLRSSLVLVLVKSRSVFRPLRTADYRPAATTWLSSLTSARPVRVLLLGTALGGNSGAELILKSLRTTLIFFSWLPSTTTIAGNHFPNLNSFLIFQFIRRLFLFIIF